MMGPWICGSRLRVWNIENPQPCKTRTWWWNRNYPMDPALHCEEVWLGYDDWGRDLSFQEGSITTWIQGTNFEGWGPKSTTHLRLPCHREARKWQWQFWNPRTGDSQKFLSFWKSRPMIQCFGDYLLLTITFWSFWLLQVWSIFW